ncbi:unnamed protein product [Rotaria sordida]|nr:unnamed protein product [Rotaria sordida]CAF1220714.1 unnamed protein product [Rotaria sordida]CAF1354380.1 unnamed protein product [Rotaria sordida]CAF1603588.1 unnamed protein product [Rotaria sordida]
MCDGFVRYENLDIEGNDISHVDGVLDYATCCSICQAIYGCFAFTYSPSSQQCSPKISISSGKNSTGDAITGYNPNMCGGFVRKDNWDIPGNDLLPSPVQQPDYASCCSQCQATYGCIAFTYSPSSQKCSLKTSMGNVILNIPADAQWKQNGTTVAGGNERGNATNQFDRPYGLFIDNDQTMVIGDCSNGRVMQWKMGDTDGKVVAGGNGKENRLDQLNCPIDVLIDKETDSLIICDRDNNRRVVRWSRRNDTAQGEILIDNIDCYGLVMDDQKYLYVSQTEEKDEVRRYQIGDKNGTLVAGGNGQGVSLNQLNFPSYIFVDQEQTVYVSDTDNHRVIKWNKGATEGIVVAGGEGQGNALTRLSHPHGLFVDTLGTIYVADSSNNRVMRWSKGAKQGTVIVGGNGLGARENQFNYPVGLFFDRYGNLYVVDCWNHRVQRFSIE